jgi:hypothetical protein
VLGSTSQHAIPERGIAPSTANSLIADEHILDGSLRFNLATLPISARRTHLSARRRTAQQATDKPNLGMDTNTSWHAR